MADTAQIAAPHTVASPVAPTLPEGRDTRALHRMIFLGIALVLTAVQDLAPADILAIDVEDALAPFDLRNQLSSNRTQGIPNMIALIRDTAARYA